MKISQTEEILMRIWIDSNENSPWNLTNVFGNPFYEYKFVYKNHFNT